MAGLFGCGGKKYKLIYEDNGFKSAKTEYAAGERVTVYFDLIGTDTDYRFYFEDVDVKQDYDWKKGYIFKFVMPDHDVKISYESHNSMMMDPNAHIAAPLTDAADAGEVPEGWWRCPECGNVNEGKFCSECGREKPEG